MIHHFSPMFQGGGREKEGIACKPGAKNVGANGLRAFWENTGDRHLRSVGRFVKRPYEKSPILAVGAVHERPAGAL